MFGDSYYRKNKGTDKYSFCVVSYWSDQIQRIGQ